MVVYGTLDVTLSGVLTQTKNKPRLSICHPKLVNMRILKEFVTNSWKYDIPSIPPLAFIFL